ncbi:hypothetical protein QAD02_004488 [Eretmocerus hayati]|uniref:Uncharacterized protein n=1 Tax=Eretmocerus hayati TaxID=131215 RepID=A0ACC2NRK1_9HYME|nr:hypothetical protein QAD02_004488 [Eretmocerus hayati]
MDRLVVGLGDEYFELNNDMPGHRQDNIKRYGQLNSAIRQGQREIVESLLKVGAPVNRNFTCHALRTPLHSAVLLGDLGIVKLLLSRGASVNAMYSNDTPLTLAAKCGKYDIVESLLLAKGLKNRYSSEKMSHFHIACMRNQVDVAKKLVSIGNINDAVDTGSEYWPGFTALHFAVQFQCLETVELLLSAGANITLQEKTSLTPLHLAHMCRNEKIIDMILVIHERVFVNPTNSRGLSHFHIACTRNNTKIFEHFLKLGVNLDDSVPPKPIWYQQHTVLDLAVHYECTDVVKLILESCEQMELYRSSELNIIRNAYSTGNMEMVNLLTTKLGTGDRLVRNSNKKLRTTEELTNLYKLFGDINLETMQPFQSQPNNVINTPITSNGGTFLHAAIESKNYKVTNFLLTQGADCTVQNIQGESPIHLAFRQNMNCYVDSMLKDHEKYLKNPTDGEGVSHFHIACARYNENIVKHFIQLGADVNGPVSNDALFYSGFTPLHFAAKFGNEKVAEILLNHGANFSTNDASNLSSFDAAFMEAYTFKRDGPLEIMKLILESQNQRKDKFFNDRGLSLLHIACMRPYFKAAYLNKPLNIDALEELLKTQSEFINSTVNMMNCNWDGYSPLHFTV